MYYGEEKPKEKTVEEKKQERKHMYVILLAGEPKACCYNEVDAEIMTDILGDGAHWMKVPVTCFHDSRNDD